jgi:hypothetical protein
MFHDKQKARMQKIGIRSGVLAAVCSIPAPKLSNFFSGKDSLSAERTKRLDETLRDIPRLQRCFPVEVSLSDAKTLEFALRRFRAGLFQEFETLTQDPTRRWNVIAV